MRKTSNPRSAWRVLSCVPALAALITTISTSSAADLRLSRVFSDHMVLQREKPVKVWGWADDGEQLTIEFAGQTKTATVGADGAWMAVLDPMSVSAQGRTLTIQSATKNRKVEIQDVLVGDVWLLGGQSNMEFALNDRIVGSKEAAAAADNPILRWMAVATEARPDGTDDIPVTLSSDWKKPCGEWRICTPANVKHFSAVGYFFAREVQAETKVPLGLVECCWGGTYSESWVSRQTLVDLHVKTVDDLLAGFDQKAAAWDANPVKEDPRRMRNWPGGCYNAMVYPIKNFAVRGALFYQGENNAVDGDRFLPYAQTYPAVIRQWRRDFDAPELPFCIIQMAPWNSTRAKSLDDKSTINSPSCFVREVHLQTHLSVPHTGMVVTMDVGRVGNMHPLDKAPVGKRAANWALAEVYGAKGRPWRGPVYSDFMVNGSRVVIRFQKEGLKRPLKLQKPEGRMDGFVIAGEDKVWHLAEAEIKEETVEVWSAAVTTPVAVRYAWCNLFNQVNLLVDADGLPASPFRTDDIPVVYVPKTKK